MRIDEAIKRLEKMTGWADDDEMLKNDEALWLGIEALKREKEYRHLLLPSDWDLLPGEKEE